MGALSLARLEVPSDATVLERTADGKDSASAALERIVAFVPTEVLTLYLALLALVDTSEDGVRWLITATCVVLAPIAVLVAHRERETKMNEDRKANGRPPKARSTPAFSMVAAAVSFALWVVVLPDSVAASLDAYSSRGALAVLLVGEFALGLADRLLRPKAS